MPIELPGPGRHEKTETGGGLSYYWVVLRRSQVSWIACAFAGLLLGLLSTFSQEPVFKARSSVEIVGLNDNFLNLKQASPLAEASAASDTDIQTQIKILQSDSLQDEVIAKLKRKAPPAKPATVRSTAWRRIFHLSETSVADGYERELRNVSKSLKVRAAGLTRVIEITTDSKQAQVAADFANTLASEIMEHNLEARWRTTEETSAWLSRQLDDMRIKLERSEDALQHYARDSGLIFTDEKTNISAEKLRDIQLALSRSQDDRIGKQSRSEMAASSPADALPDVLNNASLQAERAQLTDLRRQLAELLTTFTPEHIKVRRLQAEIGTLEAAVTRDRQAILDRIRNEYQEAERRETLLAAAYAGQARLVSGEGEKAIQYNILKREADSNRQLYEAMLQQLKESSIASAMRASNVRLLDTAKAPQHPYKPNASHNAFFGLMAGIFLGAVFIIVRDRSDRTIRQPGDLEAYLRVSELGIIPSAGKNASPRLKTVAGQEPLPGSVQETRVELASCDTRPSVIAESFRSVLVSLLFSEDDGSRPKLLVLTSASPSEGKSTVASNLAIVMANIGQRVLLIDADLRRPRQHEIFDIDNARGLTTLLRENPAPGTGRRFMKLIHQTNISNLYLLPSGPPSMAAANLLCNPGFPEFLDHVRSEFDAVIIDSPPMLQMPDARILGRLADGVILVVRAGKTTREAAFAVKKRFTEDGTKLVGTILNQWSLKNAAAAGYYGYHANSYLEGAQLADEAELENESVHSA
jgi:capsular exopolysaccharide synthesis family protein